MIKKQVQVVFLGAPGSGKGTQASIISEELKVPHVDTGSMLRAAVAEGTELGKLAKEKMDQGQLVPPDIVIGIIGERLSKADCDNGFMLDGFPRNLVQAEGLDQILTKINKQLTHVLNIDVDESILTDRLVYRRSCANCDAKYNLKFNPPKSETICDKCGGNLTQRSDDNLENTKRRFATYKEETEPLINFYKNKGLLHNINGNNSVEGIFDEIMETLK
ncbi:MAG: adenylate kinase [Vampirovibrionia bacterium]